MSMNDVKLQARIPFDIELKNGDDEKRAFVGFSASVRRNYKPEGEKYYPEDMIYCKAFGKTAIFIANHFEKGSNLLISGELRRDDDYEKDGETVKGQMYVQVTDVYFTEAKSDEKSDKKEQKEEKPAAKPAAKAAPAGLNPLSKGKKGPWAK